MPPVDGGGGIATSQKGYWSNPDAQAPKHLDKVANQPIEFMVKI